MRHRVRAIAATTRAPVAVSVCLAGLALASGACGSSEEPDSDGSPDAGGATVGTYSCKHPGDTEPTAYEFGHDGAVTIKTPGFTDHGTSSGNGAKGVITVEGNETRFTIEGDRLVFAGDPTYDCSKGS